MSDINTDGVAAKVATDGMTPVDYGSHMYIPDVEPMVDLNVPIPEASQTHFVEGP